MRKFKFCPKCGEKLVDKNIDHTTVPVCSQCGFKFFQNSKPTASAVIHNGHGKVMLLNRAMNPSCGKWDIMGGFLYNGENPIKGLQREAMEELGMKLKVGKIIGIYIDTYNTDGDDFYTFNVYYAGKLTGTPKLDHENIAIKWFTKSEIPWNNLAFKNTKKALKDFFRK